MQRGELLLFKSQKVNAHYNFKRGFSNKRITVSKPNKNITRGCKKTKRFTRKG